MNAKLLAATVASAGPGRSQRPVAGGRPARQGHGDVHADGRQRRRRRDLGAHQRRAGRGRGVRHQDHRAVFRVAAGEDARAVPPGGCGQAGLHRDHGPPRQQRVRAAGQAGARQGHPHHGGQLAAHQDPEDVRLTGHRLCRRRPVHGRRDHRVEDARSGTEVGRQGAGVRPARRSRARASPTKA